MVVKILEHLPAIKRVFADDKSHHTLPNLTWQDITVLEAVKDGLKPFAEFTDILSAENYVTVSSLLPMLHLMMDILKEEEADIKMTSEIKKGILEKLESKYDDNTLQLMCKATLLDPRYKGDHIEPEQLDVGKSQLEVEMVAFHNIIKPLVRIREEEEEEKKEVAGAAAEIQPAKRTKTLGRLLDRVKQSMSTIPADQREKKWRSHPNCKRKLLMAMTNHWNDGKIIKGSLFNCTFTSLFLFFLFSNICHSFFLYLSLLYQQVYCY